MDDEKLENNNNSFVIVSKNVVEALAQTEISNIRKGNNDINKQLERDIDMLSQAIVHYGTSESDKIKAQTLLKSILLLYFGDISYRDKNHKTFHSWSELKGYSQLHSFPIAAVLLHGSRALIEFPSVINEGLIDWLITDKASWRYVATHGIKELAENEKEILENGLIKCLKEIKVNLLSSAVNFLAKPLASLGSYAFSTAINMVSSVHEVIDTPAEVCLEAKENRQAQHYGVDLALGGAGNNNFFSGKTISNNGEHGHLYIHCYDPNGGQYGGLLLGIEQSAPGKDDQYGGVHDAMASVKAYSASGGDFFCKPSEDTGVGDLYIGLTELPIADYYDSLWNSISEETFTLIQEAYKQANLLLDFLPREESRLNFIKEIISSSGKSNKAIFDQLFYKYAVKLPLVKDIQELNVQRTIEVRIIAEDNERLQQEREYFNKLLSKQFMETVSKHMGWFSKNSAKKIIFTQLINRLVTRACSKTEMVWILKNFINVALMNRYTTQGRETHSGKACVNLLNDPDYVVIKQLLLYSAPDPVRYSDLLRLSHQESNNSPTFFSSVCYPKLCQAFGIKAHTKNASNEKLECALNDFVYKPGI